MCQIDIEHTPIAGDVRDPNRPLLKLHEFITVFQELPNLAIEQG